MLMRAQTMPGPVQCRAANQETTPDPQVVEQRIHHIAPPATPASSLRGVAHVSQLPPTGSLDYVVPVGRVALPALFYPLAPSVPHEA